MRVAVIDTGTNSTRLLVADVQDERVEETERLTTVTRLGQGAAAGGCLNADARERVRDCVEDYAAVIGKLGAGRVMVIATSAVREAGNGAEFIAELAGRFGFESRVLSGDEEARLSFSGATVGEAPGRSIALFDIGGGSTEVVTGRDGQVIFARSLTLGCVRLTERFFGSDPAGADELAAASAFISRTLKREIARAPLASAELTIAVAGTATALAAIDLRLQTYDRRLVHGHTMTYRRIEELLGQLAAMTVAQRLEIPTMEQGRADVIVAGTLIMERLMRHAEADKATISESDILDGTALSMAQGRI